MKSVQTDHLSDVWCVGHDMMFFSLLGRERREERGERREERGESSHISVKITLSCKKVRGENWTWIVLSRRFMGCLRDLYKIFRIIPLNICNGGQCSKVTSDKMINPRYLLLISTDHQWMAANKLVELWAVGMLQINKNSHGRKISRHTEVWIIHLWSYNYKSNLEQEMWLIFSMMLFIICWNLHRVFADI